MDITSALMEPEEGEISDSEYTPLPRPATLQASSSSSLAISNASRLAPPPLSSEDDASSASSADSDDSGPRPAKSRRPRRPPAVTPHRPPAVPAKYKVWSQDVQADALNEQLINCDVEHKYDRSRDVESYDYNMLRPKFDAERASTSPVGMEEAGLEQEEQPITNKRRHRERGNVKQRLGRRVDPTPQDFARDDDGRSPSPRFLLDLHPEPDPTPEEVTLDIANKLWEEKEDLVRKVVEVLGAERAIQLYNKTKDIEADGGMMILNGARRRTPGGVFFYLLRHEADVSREQHDAIFSEDYGAHAAHKRAANRRKRAANVDRLRAAEEERLEKERERERDAALPGLLTRAEECVQQLAQERERGEEGEVEEVEEQEEGEAEEAEVSNPPPSPATDPRENVGGGNGPRKVTSYDEDDFLEVGVNDDEMEMF